MIVVDEEAGYATTETFRINVPADIPVYSRNWSHATNGDNSGGLAIDGVSLNSRRVHGGWYIAEGDITVNQLSPNEYHEISIYNANGNSYAAIMLIYKE